MYRRIRSLRSAASIVFVTVLTIVSSQQARAGGGDLDNDGIPDGIDPCPSQPLNDCAGPVAVDTATGNDIRIDTGPTCAATFTDCRGASWISEWGDIVTLGSGYSHVLQSTVCNLPNGCPVNATSLFACTDVATETLFKCEHWDHPTNDPELNYSFDVPDGSYVVNLLFMNSFTGTAAAGARVFDINIEGSPAFVGFDQVAIAGGPCDPAIAPCLPVVRAALVNVIDGNGLQLELIHVVENPSIKGIEVLVDLSGSGCTLDADCNDGNPCTTDTCNTGTGVCQFANNTDLCDDLVACTSGDVCAGGVCAGTDNCPMGEQCNSSTGLCEPIPECIVDADCAPAVPPCEGGELCIAGTCTAQPDAASGTACELDSDLCTIDECDGAGTCANVGSVSCPVGELCNPGNGQCAGPDADNDGLSDVTDPCPADPRNLCFGPVAVDGTTGTDIRLNANSSTAECAGAKLDCNGDVWAADFGFNQGNSATCNLAGGCPIGGIDVIFGAGCSGDAQFAETEDLFQCERWDPAPAPELQYSFDVPDGNYLVNMLLANTCACTANPGDRIFDIVIEGAAAYTNLDQVEAAGGSGIAVVRAALVTVADGNGLQIDFLHVIENPAIKAIEVLTAPACTMNADCADGNPCTDDICAAGSCTNPNNTAPCDDSVACTTGDVCAGGACAGTPDDALCDDTIECTDDVCTAAGCTNDPTAPGTPCADDGNPCTDNACDGAGSCAATNNTAACDDGVACTTGDTCAGGVCAGTPDDNLCDDSSECTVDSCDPALDCQNVAVADGTPCDDGLPSTPMDQCIAGVCVGEARVTVALVAVPTPTATDEVGALPVSTTTYNVGDTFHLEVWAQTIESDGLSSATVDLSYSAALTSATALTNSSVFNQFPSGTIDNGAGTVDDLGGSHPVAAPPCSDQVGLEPSWAKVATIDMLAVLGGSQTIGVGDAASELLGTAICNTLGNVDPTEILFQGVDVTTLCQASDETCDGIDDNCSGTADDGYVSTPTSCGVGACAASGSLDCIGGVEVDSCVPGTPTTEVCDGVDNNCDGTIDDEPDASASCTGSDFCDGPFVCSGGSCVAGMDACPDECESCDPDEQACGHCVFDHNLSGAIDGLDFAFFSGCFGSCYATTDTCFAANYDGDVDGCVGGGDFGLFSGCFSLTCGECTLCFPWEGGPAPEGPDEGIVSVVAVPVARPSADDFGLELPGALKRLGVGQTFYVELWARADGFGDGLASTYVDIVFDPAHVDVRDHHASAQFPNFAYGAELLKGRVAALGGCAQLGDGALGLGGEWVRSGIVEFVGRQAGEVQVLVEPARAPFGVSIFARPGDLRWGALELEGASVTVEGGRTKTHANR